MLNLQARNMQEGTHTKVSHSNRAAMHMEVVVLHLLGRRAESRMVTLNLNTLLRSPIMEEAMEVVEAEMVTEVAEGGPGILKEEVDFEVVVAVAEAEGVVTPSLG